MRSAIQKLAQAYRPQELGHDAYLLHERSRSSLPEGVTGGCQGERDLGLIEEMTR